MNISKWLALAMAATITVGGLTTSFSVRAEDNGGADSGPGHRSKGGLLARIKERLDLSDDQVAQIKAVLSADKDKLTALLKSLREKQVDLRDVIEKTGATEGEIRAAAAKVAAVESDLAVERARLFSKISPILDADQLEKISEIQQHIDDFLDNAIVSIGERLTQ